MYNERNTARRRSVDPVATSEDRLKILKLVRDGKITAEEGIELIEALETSPGPPTRPGPSKEELPGSLPGHPGPSMAEMPPQPPARGGARWLRVQVTDTITGKIRVNVRLPITVVSAGMKMGARFSPGVEGLNMGELMSAIRSGETGQIMDVYDDEDNEHVEVFIE